MNNAGVTGWFEPPKTDFEHARVFGPCNPAYAFWHTVDIQTDTCYIYHVKSRLNTPVWGSLRSPNNNHIPVKNLIFHVIAHILSNTLCTVLDEKKEVIKAGGDM